MTAQLIDGKSLANHVLKDVAEQVEAMKRKHLRPPALAVILVGDDPASHIYVDRKRQACVDTGIVSRYHPLPAETSEITLVTLIQELNQDPSIDGILLQVPLPKHINSDALLELINPHKDVDGFHPYNVGRLVQRRPLMRPCTPYGIIALLDSIQEPYKNRHAVIVGASNIVGRPLTFELLLAGATVTICHRFTDDLAFFVKQADILVAAAGKPHLISGSWIKPGATVIDVGINRLPNGSVIGDVDFESARQHAAWITPVPGGVGPMTIAMLLKNTLKAATLFSQ